MSKTATLIKTLDDSFRGQAGLYEMDPPLVEESWDDEEEATEHRYVIISATVVPYGFAGPETYIFPASGPDATGPSSWGELSGSQRGTLSHREVLSDLGYEIVEG